jgi:predicted membrane chloride channel (bestrophin family)
MAVSDMRIESKTHMDESVRVLQESLGSCEKILTTPIPISYTRHTGRFLVLWLTCLPFVIWQVGGCGFFVGIHACGSAIRCSCRGSEMCKHHL